MHLEQNIKYFHKICITLPFVWGTNNKGTLYHGLGPIKSQLIFIIKKTKLSKTCSQPHTGIQVTLTVYESTTNKWKMEVTAPSPR